MQQMPASFYKHIAKKIVDVAEKIPGALAPEQYARKGRRCGSQVLNKANHL
jgi:hypothetical protein